MLLRRVSPTGVPIDATPAQLRSIVQWQLTFDGQAPVLSTVPYNKSGPGSDGECAPDAHLASLCRDLGATKDP